MGGLARPLPRPPWSGGGEDDGAEAQTKRRAPFPPAAEAPRKGKTVCSQVQDRANGRSRELSPARKPYRPGDTVHFFSAGSQNARSSSAAFMVRVLVSPGCRKTLPYAFNSLAGLGVAPAGGLTYTCTTSAPARLPVLLTVTENATPSAPSRVDFRSDKANRV